jgi:hypothetical protein
MRTSQEYFESTVDSAGPLETEIQLNPLRRLPESRPASRRMSWFAASTRMNYDVFLRYLDRCGILEAQFVLAMTCDASFVFLTVSTDFFLAFQEGE